MEYGKLIRHMQLGIIQRGFNGTSLRKERKWRGHTHIAVAAGGGTPCRGRSPKLKKENAEDIHHRFSSSRLGWHARSTAMYLNVVFLSLLKIAGAARRIFDGLLP